MSHLGQAWGRTLAWRVPTEIRGYPLPIGGQFAHTQDTLDPDLFDPSERMWPWIRGSLIDILEAFWRPRYGDWAPWTRIYLAGSLASYWHSTLDFDTLVGVDTHRFVREHPEFGGMSDAEVCQALTHEFITELDPLVADWSFPPEPNLHRLMETLGGPDPSPVYHSVPMTVVTGLGPMEMTWYVNPSAYDIRTIRPYAAYDVTRDRWAVHPDRMAKSWGAQALGHAFWERMADTADEIKAALKLPEPARTSEALRIYDRIHTDRGQAFAPAGRGVTDPRSLQWIVLNRWGLLGPLEVAAHPGREMAHIPPAIASQRRTGSSETYYHASPHRLREGDELRPRAAPSNFTEGANSLDHVYLSKTEGEARDWGAVIGAGRHPVMHVYEVQPHDEPEETDSGFYGLREHRSRGATVLRHLYSYDPVDE